MGISDDCANLLGSMAMTLRLRDVTDDERVEVQGSRGRTPLELPLSAVPRLSCMLWVA
jgi:hypothetical protein